MIVIDRRTFAMWLNIIDPGHFKSRRTRRMIELFRREAVAAIDRCLDEDADGIPSLGTLDHLREKGLPADSVCRAAVAFEEKVVAAYVDRHGYEPEQFPAGPPNGEEWDFSICTEADRDLMDDVWDTCFDPQGLFA